MNKLRSGGAAVTLGSSIYVMGGWDGIHHMQACKPPTQSLSLSLGLSITPNR